MALPGLDRVTVTLRGTGELDEAAQAYARAISSASTPGAVAPEEYVAAMVNDPDLVRSRLATIRSVVGPNGLIESNTVTPYFSADFAR